MPPICCKAPVPRFAFPTHEGPLPNDQRIKVTVPGGFLDFWGLYHDPMMKYRLSEPQLLKTIRTYSSSPQPLWVEFTRDLNKPASYFYNESSCWWETFGPGNWVSSRCSLKSWGGVGMRSFANGITKTPNGRVWIFPLDKDLRPTHDTLGATGFVLLNGYGALHTLEAATIIGDLTGLAHKYIKTPQPKRCLEVDGAEGYLVAPKEVCDVTKEVNFGYKNHWQFDAEKFQRAA